MSAVSSIKVASAAANLMSNGAVAQPFNDQNREKPDWVQAVAALGIGTSATALLFLAGRRFGFLHWRIRWDGSPENSILTRDPGGVKFGLLAGAMSYLAYDGLGNRMAKPQSVRHVLGKFGWNVGSLLHDPLTAVHLVAASPLLAYGLYQVFHSDQRLYGMLLQARGMCSLAAAFAFLGTTTASYLLLHEPAFDDHYRWI